MSQVRTLLHPVTGQERVWLTDAPARELPLRGAQAMNPDAPAALGRILRPESSMNWLSTTLRAMTPQRIEGILRGALGGNFTSQWELFDLMEETWPQLLKNTNEIKRAVCKLSWRLDAWAEEEEAPSESASEKAKFISRALWRMRPDPAKGDNAFKDTIYDILDAWFKGVSVLEVLWTQNADGIVPQGTAWVNPSYYAWGEDGALGLAINRPGATGTPSQLYNPNIFTGGRTSAVAPFPADKFLVCVARAKTSHPSSAALLRPLAWWWCAANFSAEWLLNFGQIFGLPIRWATYDPAQPGLLEKISDMLENMGSTAWGAFPTGTSFELKESGKSGSGSDTPQASMLDRADRQCNLLLLGQTLTSDVGSQGSGSRALGQVHERVKDDILQAAADFAATVLNNQLIPSILRLNWGDDSEAPEFCPEEMEVQDKKANADRVLVLTQAGLKIPSAWVYKDQDIPMPQPNEEVIGGTLPVGPQANGSGISDLGSGIEGADGTTENPADTTSQAQMKASLSGARGATRPTHAHDEVTDKLIESVSGVEARWLGGLRPFYRELILLAQNAASDAEFESKLQAVIDQSARSFPELFAKMDVQFLADRLEGIDGRGLA
jgi:phage gp29-like protein